MKKIVTIQDISCFGKCSLTVALPIISAMGIETAVIPTAVLSTHTGGFTNYTFHDLSDDITDIANHWKSLNLHFDAIYTGYLGSASQIKIVSDFFDRFKTSDNFIVVDPVLGDHGKLYAGFTDKFVANMRKLCAKADYIMPNMTEACLLLGLPYTENYNKNFVKETLEKLSKLGCHIPILTGVRFDEKYEGAAAYDPEKDEYFFSFDKHVNRRLHGTGDIFASVFTGAITLNKSVQESLDIAVKFIADCIEATIPCADEMWYGSCFEVCLGKLIDYTKQQ